MREKMLSVLDVRERDIEDYIAGRQSTADVDVDITGFGQDDIISVKTISRGHLPVFYSIYRRQQCRNEKLTGLQKSWASLYFAEATGEIKCSGNEYLICPVLLRLLNAIDNGEMSANFSEIELLSWNGAKLSKLGKSRLRELTPNK